MLRARFLSFAVIMPLAIGLTFAGGWVYALSITIVLGIGGHEYTAAMRTGGYRPYRRILMGTILLIALAQGAGLMPGVLGPGLAAFLLIAMLAMLAAYGEGDHQPAINFGITVTGALYIGWLGAHLIAIRQLPEGLYWTLIAVLGTGFADVGAYVIGRALGHHQMSPVVSPGKTWEGYLGGAITATGMGALVAALSAADGAAIRAVDGAVVGLLVGLLSPAGDLAMSTFKRMVNIKNFGRLLPGHGGMLDRLDSMLVGVTVAYYCIIWFLIGR